MRYYSILLNIILFLIGTIHPSAQELRNPFDFPILLSGNFGELRGNHFHAGIDFKTQGAEGKAVRAVEDGYVSRISVSPWGYGNALYIVHPNGLTTVYGHLQRFADSIAVYVKEQQYEQESFAVNLLPEPDQFPVRKGQIIALSGNSGSSGGPHLHLEIRETESDELLDPIPFYKNLIKDTRPPQIQGVMIYPVEGRGVVNGSNQKLELKPVRSKDGKQVLTGKIQAWGDIALAVKGYDYMDNTSNIYGVRKVALRLDTVVVFRSNINRFPLDESRFLNSFTDYEEWTDNRSFFMKSFVEPGNRLSFIESINRGILTIDEERTYRLTYLLQDVYGNSSRINVWIEGKEQPIPSPNTLGAEYFHWKSENRFGAKGIRFTIPAGNLYDDLYFRYSVKEDSTALSATHLLHDRSVPLHGKAELSLRLQNDSLDNKEKYGIVRKRNNRLAWIGGTYRNGWIDAEVRDFGNYLIAQDTIPPAITPVNPTAWAGSQKITFRITDNLSGIKTYRGEIDGAFVLFELDGKKGQATYQFDKNRLPRGNHKLTFTVTDNCGNQSVYEHSFVW